MRYYHSGASCWSDSKTATTSNEEYMRTIPQPREETNVPRTDAAIDQSIDTLQQFTREYLAQAAIETILHVVQSKVLQKSLALKYGLTDIQVEGTMNKAALDLVDDIRHMLGAASD